MHRTIIYSLLIGWALTAAGARALTIASYTDPIAFSGSATGSVATGIRFDLCFKPSPPAVSATCQFLFGGTDPLTAGLVLTEADVGRTFVADGGTPGFPLASSLLTNGSEDTIGILSGVAPSSTAGVLRFSEFAFFESLADLDLAAGPDLAGFAITAITFTVLDLDLNLLFGNASAVGDVRIDFIGTPVPEPTPASLLLLGTSALAASRALVAPRRVARRP